MSIDDLARDVKKHEVQQRAELLGSTPEPQGFRNACAASQVEAHAALERRALAFAQSGGMGRTDSASFVGVLCNRIDGLSIEAARRIQRKLGR